MEPMQKYQGAQSKGPDSLYNSVVAGMKDAGTRVYGAAQAVGRHAKTAAATVAGATVLSFGLPYKEAEAAPITLPAFGAGVDYTNGVVSVLPIDQAIQRFTVDTNTYIGTAAGTTPSSNNRVGLSTDANGDYRTSTLGGGIMYVTDNPTGLALTNFGIQNVGPTFHDGRLDGGFVAGSGTFVGQYTSSGTLEDSWTVNFSINGISHLLDGSVLLSDGTNTLQRYSGTGSFLDSITFTDGPFQGGIGAFAVEGDTLAGIVNSGDALDFGFAGSVIADANTINVVPTNVDEPHSWAMLLLALPGFAALRRFRNK